MLSYRHIEEMNAKNP